MCQGIAYRNNLPINRVWFIIRKLLVVLADKRTESLSTDYGVYGPIASSQKYAYGGFEALQIAHKPAKAHGVIIGVHFSLPRFAAFNREFSDATLLALLPSQQQHLRRHRACPFPNPCKATISD